MSDLDEEELKATKELNTKEIEKSSSIQEKQEKSSCKEIIKYFEKYVKVAEQIKYEELPYIEDREKEHIKNIKVLLDLYNKEKETSHFIQSQLDEANAKLIEKQKEIEFLKSQIPVDKIFYYSYKDFISKDKIREKIKELENQKDLYFEKQIIQGKIDLLKELLEE